MTDGFSGSAPDHGPHENTQARWVPSRAAAGTSTLHPPDRTAQWQGDGQVDLTREESNRIKRHRAHRVLRAARHRDRDLPLAHANSHLA